MLLAGMTVKAMDALAHLRIRDHTPFRLAGMRRVAAICVLGLDLQGGGPDRLGDISPRAVPAGAGQQGAEEDTCEQVGNASGRAGGGED